MLSERQHLRNLLAVVGGSALVIAAWLCVPFAWEPYVRVPSSTIAIGLACVPKEIVIVAGPRQAEPRTIAIERLRNEDGSGQLRVVQQTKPVSTIDRASRFQFAPPSPEGTVASEEGGYGTRAVIDFSRGSFVDLREVKFTPLAPAPACSSTVLKGKPLVDAVTTDRAQLMRYRLIQEDLSNLVLAFNSTVGNLMLAGMVLYLFWNLYVGAVAFWSFYVRSDGQVRNATLTSGDNESELRGRHLVQQRRLGMARVMGPALGFFLTVSSLAAALHPAVQARQDAFQFVSAIQIAVLSTLIGLAIRIVAQVTSTLVRDNTERALLLIETGADK